jgi:hypothetical protein
MSPYSFTPVAIGRIKSAIGLGTVSGGLCPALDESLLYMSELPKLWGAPSPGRCWFYRGRRVVCVREIFVLNDIKYKR